MGQVPSRDMSEQIDALWSEIDPSLSQPLSVSQLRDLLTALAHSASLPLDIDTALTLCISHSPTPSFISKSTLDTVYFQALTEQIRSQICKQVEFYLSDSNLKRDLFFYEKIQKAEGGFIPLKVFLKCPKVRKLTNNEEEIANSMVLSSELELNRDKTAIRRLNNRKLPDFHRFPSKSVLYPQPTFFVYQLFPSENSCKRAGWREIQGAFREQYGGMEVGWVGEGRFVLPGNTEEGVRERVEREGIWVDGERKYGSRVEGKELMETWRKYGSQWEAAEMQFGVHTQYKFGGQCFHSPGKVKSYLRSLLSSSSENSPIPPQFHPFLFDLLKLHPDFELKSHDFDHFEVGRLNSHKTFVVVKKDGRKEDLEAEKCLGRV